MHNIMDLSHTIRDGMPVYPGDGKSELVQSRFLDIDRYNNHELRIGMHVGTHMDAPLHMLAGGRRISDLPLETCIGPGCLLDVRGQNLISWLPNYEKQVKEGDIVLLYTGHDSWFGTPYYFTDNPLLDVGFAKALLRKRVRLLGMDLPSPDGPPFPVHKLLLGAGIFLLENLTNLKGLLAWPEFEVVALPLNIWADGAPARVIALQQ